MSESIWPAQPQPILETASSSIQNTTQTDQQSPVDRCRLEKDALRGILMELKRGVKVMQERQDALHKCMTGRSLTDTLQWGGGYNSAVNLIGDIAMMGVCIDRIAFTAGIDINGN